MLQSQKKCPNCATWLHGEGKCPNCDEHLDNAASEPSKESFPKPPPKKVADKIQEIYKQRGFTGHSEPSRDTKFA